MIDAIEQAKQSLMIALREAERVHLSRFIIARLHVAIAAVEGLRPLFRHVAHLSHNPEGMSDALHAETATVTRIARSR